MMTAFPRLGFRNIYIWERIFSKGMVQNPGSHPYHTMAQASVPYYGTRSVPYPRKGMVQTSVPYYGTSAVPYPTTSFSIPAAISRAIPSQSRAIPVPYLGHIDKCRAHSFPSREPYRCHTRAIPQGVQEPHGLTVSPAVCCFEGFVVASGAGLSCLLCSWTSWGMARVWHA